MLVLERTMAQQRSLEERAEEADYRAKKSLHEAAALLRDKRAPQAETHKKRALMYRKQAATFRQQANNLVQQMIVLQEASINAEVHDTMQQSLRTGQALVQHIDVDDVAETADEWASLYGDAQEIGRALSEPLTLGSNFAEEDADALDEEISQLMETQTLEDDLRRERDAHIELPSLPRELAHAGGGGGGTGGDGGGGSTGLKVRGASSIPH